VFGRKCVVNSIHRECRAFVFYDSDIYLTKGIFSLAPNRLTIAKQRHYECRSGGHFLCIHVQLDLNALREVSARFIVNNVAANDEKQAFATHEEETASASEQLLLVKRLNSRGEQ
jgi:hypothetical protein